jgi:hypothetical protein
MVDAKAIYKRISKRDVKFIEEIHCPLIIDKMVKEYCRLSSFLCAAEIGPTVFSRWLSRHELFNQCFEVGCAISEEQWEKEYPEKQDFDEIEEYKHAVKEWNRNGRAIIARRESTKIYLDVDASANPWQQYQQIIEQAKTGAFNASEIKQVMESLNAGTRVFEVFKLQQEVDKMKVDLIVMGARNGNNIRSIAGAS